MPKLMTDDMQVVTTPNNFQFSATRMENLEGAFTYTLVTLIVDNTGSVAGFKNELEQCIKVAIESCGSSPQVENLMIRVARFDSSVPEEIHGFKLFRQIDLADYNGCLNPGGMTALYDAVFSSTEITSEFGKTLMDQDYVANAVTFIITDGGDNCSSSTPENIKQLIAKIKQDETYLESITTILVGVNTVDYNLQTMLDNFKNEAELDQYIDIKDADTKSLARLAQFISKSISSTSQSLGTGQPSSLLTF